MRGFKVETASAEAGPPEDVQNWVKLSPLPHQQVIHDFWPAASMCSKAVHKIWIFIHHGTLQGQIIKWSKAIFFGFLAFINSLTGPGHLITHGPLEKLDVLFTE